MLDYINNYLGITHTSSVAFFYVNFFFFFFARVSGYVKWRLLVLLMTILYTKNKPFYVSSGPFLLFHTNV